MCFDNRQSDKASSHLWPDASRTCGQHTLMSYQEFCTPGISMEVDFAYDSQFPQCPLCAPNGVWVEGETLYPNPVGAGGILSLVVG